MLLLLFLTFFLPATLLADPMFGKKELLTNNWEFILDEATVLPGEIGV